MELVWPRIEYLESYTAALRKGWSPDNIRPELAQEELERIAADPILFIAQQVDPDAKGPPVVLKDGTTVPRIPGYHRWMWDGEFCGSISFRWVPGTTDLPPHCLGHIGYSVVPWKRRRGYATQALGLLLQDIRGGELDFVEITTTADNHASRRVIEENGGILVETFRKGEFHGGGEALRFRISLT
jgi:predicted acetyltransferase